MSKRVTGIAINHDKPILASTVKEVDGYLLHGIRGGDGFQGFMGLAWTKRLARFVAPYNLANVIFHCWPIVKLSCIFICLDLPTVGHMERIKDTTPKWAGNHNTAGIINNEAMIVLAVNRQVVSHALIQL